MVLRDRLGSNVGRHLFQFILLMVSVSICCSSSGQFLTENSNGTVTFTGLPAGSGPVSSNYDPGAIGGWYSLASGFVDAVRPGSLPYDQILSALNDSGVQCDVGTRSNCPRNEDQDIVKIFQSLGSWWAGLLVMAIFGGILSCGFCVAGISFCCCRCCGKCGGANTQKVPENVDCRTFTFTSILFLTVLVLFAGVVLAFFSNQQTYDSVGNAQGILNDVFDHARDYVNGAIDELNFLVCQLTAENGVSGLVLEEAEQLNGTLFDLTANIQSQVDMILGNVTDLTPGLNTTIELLNNLTATVRGLRSSGMLLQSSLNNISTSIDDIMEECMNVSITCDGLPDPTIFQAGANFSLVPDVESELNTARSAIGQIDLTTAVNDGRSLFADTRQEIESTVSTQLNEAVMELREYNRTAFEYIDNITDMAREYLVDTLDGSCPPGLLDAFSDITLNIGFIRQCMVNKFFDEVQKYDVYRYAFGIIICSLSLVTVVLAIVGIVMGMVGFRKDVDPEQRTGLSHCGGIILLICVCCTFIFGYVLLALSATMFFFGSNMQKVCQGVESPDYPAYSQLVDNTEFWGGSLLGTVLPVGENVTDPQIFLTGILNNCREGSVGLFAAANLSLFLPSGNLTQEITNAVDLDEVRRIVNDSLVNSISNYNFTNNNFLSLDAQNALDEFRNASIDQINITAFREQTNSPLVRFNITETIVNLETVRDSLPSSILDNRINDTILQLMRLRDDQIPTIDRQVDELEGQVNSLEGLTDTVVTNTSDLVNTINDLILNITGNTLPQFLDQNVSGALDRVFMLVDSYILHLDTQLSFNVGVCQPIYGIYDELYSIVCRDFLEGLVSYVQYLNNSTTKMINFSFQNGFWWSLGFCALLFIPLIIFSVITSNYYLKKKTDNDGFDGYEEYQ